MRLKKILDFYINASIHVALAVYAFVRITAFYFQLPNNPNLNYFIFFGTITGYNFVKYAGVAKLHHKSLTNDLKIIQIFSLLCFFAMCFYASKISIKTFYYIFPFVGLTVLYAVPFLSGFEKNLRQISYLKIVIVALVWAGFTVLIPFVDSNTTIKVNIFLVMLQRFLIVVVLILPFDIRDVKYDAISLQTIPKKVGITKTKRLGLVLLVVSLFLEYIINVEVRNLFMIFFFFTTILLMRAEINQFKYYSSLFVEALPIFWWGLILGLS